MDKGGESMNPKDLANIIAIFDKLQIENDTNLNSAEKELIKSLIDKIKKQVQ